MEKIPGLTINEAEYNLPNGRKGKVAVFMYSGGSDPSRVLDAAISDYVGTTSYHELMDSNLDNPWMRVVLSNINDMNQKEYDPEFHKINRFDHE